MKLSISLEFDTETQTVSDVKVTSTSETQSVAKKEIVKKPATKATKKVETSKNIVLSGSSLKLNQEALDLLEVELNKGKKVVLEIVGKKVSLLNPTITATKGGNVVTNAMTIACKGKLADSLKAIGTEFEFTKKGPGELSLTLVNNDLDIAPTEQPEVLLPTDDEVKDVMLEGLGGKDADFDFDFDF